MKSALMLILFCCVILLFDMRVDAWNRRFFSRYSRNFLRNEDNVANLYKDIDSRQTFSNWPLYERRNDDAAGVGDMRRIAEEVDGSNILSQQQGAIYDGVVEPLIDFLPCNGRRCRTSDNCCAGAVCIANYVGGGKCHHGSAGEWNPCRRNEDCQIGLLCLKDTSDNYHCRQLSALTAAAGVVLASKPFVIESNDQDCVTSSDCNVNKGMCCQLQRNGHNVLTRKRCAFYRDPFMCVDISSHGN